MMQTLIACHECDLLHRASLLPAKTKARCRRCGAVLYTHSPQTIDRTLAFAVTGLVLLIIANSYPFLSLESQGTILKTTLITGTIILSQQGMAGVAILVLLTSMIVPCLLLGALVYVLWPIKIGRRLPANRWVFRLALTLCPWSMTEVFLLGVLVSVVKLAETFTVIPGIALFSFLALVFVLAAVNIFLVPLTIWEKLDEWR
jgi:paraquat-inducible protein A